MSRYMWNKFAQMFHDDLTCGLQLLPKLTYDHIRLTSYSKMNVKLAAQVLSSTFGNTMISPDSPEFAETAKFCCIMDKFFDIVNIHNTSDCKTKSKPNLEPFYSPNDHRLTWLVNDFLE